MRHEILKGWAWPWAGVFGGAAFWYAAHDLSTYLLNVNCRHIWVAPFIHIIALIGAIASGYLSYRAWPDGDSSNRDRFLSFSSMVGVAAAALFALVILWQGVAAIVFSGCER